MQGLVNWCVFWVLTPDVQKKTFDRLGMVDKAIQQGPPLMAHLNMGVGVRESEQFMN